MRFLFYAVLSMSYLGYFLLIRAKVVWDKRNHPSVRLDSECSICSWMTNI